MSLSITFIFYQVSSLHKYTFVVSRAFLAGAASQAGDAAPPGHLVSSLVCRVRESPPWCSIVGAKVTVHQFFCILHICHPCSPLTCAAGCTVPREGFDSSVSMPFSWCVVVVTLPYIVSVHMKCQASIYTLLLCRGHSWRVRLAKQKTLLLPGTWSHLWFSGVRNVHRGALLLVPQ